MKQWRNTSDCLDWIKQLENKTRKNFVQFDIVEFYPSISEKLFNDALDFASTVDHITDETRKILMNARQSLLFHNDSVWKKQSGLFDVTMGSYDGCEVCELVGLYILYKLRDSFPELDCGLYRDNGLGALKRTPKTKLERMKKDMFKLFKEEFGLKITLDTNLTIVNFLDITLDLHNDKFFPYRKPNDFPVYIHKESNHPPHVAKQLPISINKRLNNISSDKESFETFKGDYEDALRKSGHYTKLTYEDVEQQQTSNKNKKNRSRNVIWFTPPYSRALKTNLGRKFLNLIDKHFPVNHHLYKIINRKTIKISYSCTPNMQTIIASHNKKILTNQTTTPEKCNCQTKSKCPTPGKCCTPNVVYQATVSHEGRKKANYIGSTETEFKLRYNNHTKSFRNSKYQSETTLSTYVWDKKLNPNPKIKWTFIKKCSVYQLGRKTCDLCLSEKLYIIKNLHKTGLINKRTDIGNSCPHKKKCTFADM